MYCILIPVCKGKSIKNKLWQKKNQHEKNSKLNKIERSHKEIKKGAAAASTLLTQLDEGNKVSSMLPVSSTTNDAPFKPSNFTLRGNHSRQLPKVIRKLNGMTTWKLV